ncbi:50S ribosomal protein L24 [Candidatus Saccharibacteria bacterium]|nr:50S ribosomal protein L24 [Candidatus Saccharibacteria bacterium]
MRINKGDKVIVRSGKYRGRTGKVLSVQPQLNKVTVEGINVVKRHRKPTAAHPQGGIIELTKPIWVSKVGLLDAVAKKASRIGYKISKDGVKTRIMKTTGKEIK